MPTRGVLVGPAPALAAEAAVRRKQAHGADLTVVHLGTDFARRHLIERHRPETG